MMDRDTIPFDELKDGTVKNTIFKLRHLLENAIPEILEKDSLSLSEHCTYFEAVFKLSYQNLIERFADIVEKKLSMHIMYAGYRKNKEDVILIAYSTPVEDKMYSLILSSDQYGLFDILCFRIYESVEIMLYDLQKERKNVSKWTVLESQNNKDMLKIFMD